MGGTEANIPAEGFFIFEIGVGYVGKSVGGADGAEELAGIRGEESGAGIGTEGKPVIGLIGGSDLMDEDFARFRRRINGRILRPEGLLASAVVAGAKGELEAVAEKGLAILKVDRRGGGPRIDGERWHDDRDADERALI